MNSESFFELVSKMRQAQKNYFKFHTSSCLTESKRLEKDVDAEIQRVNKEISDKKEPKLF